jgi:hypothetical protein
MSKTMACPGNNDLIDLVLKILNGVHIEFASKQKISSSCDLDVRATGGYRGHRALPDPWGREGNRSGIAPTVQTTLAS